MTWVRGGAVFTITRDQMNDIDGVAKMIKGHKLTHATFPPSYLHLFNGIDFPTMESLMTVGEQPLESDVAFYADNLTYYNGYGPTENTAATTIGVLTTELSDFHAGTPMGNITVYVLNEQMQAVPPGAVGQVWTGGDSLGKGYLNLPEKTKEVFVQTEFGQLYNTGDLGRWNEQGLLEIAGRADTQVKIRGQRVELGEIEAQINKFDGVHQSYVFVETTDDRTQNLWSVVTFHENAERPTQADWHAYLSGKLPGYMVPAAVVEIDMIPLNISGKVDQNAILQHIHDMRPSTQFSKLENRTRPQTETEIRIAELWATHFPDCEIVREDNFFALGGDSLQVIDVINKLRRDYNCSVNQLYENPVLADFAKCCQYRPEHLQTAIGQVRQDWQRHIDGLDVYEEEMQQTLEGPLSTYNQRNQEYDKRDLSQVKSYQHVLLTGGTGYLGAYLLRDLLAQSERCVSVLVRGSDDGEARKRLEKTLQHYFGKEQAHTIAQNPYLTVFAADLREDQFDLDEADYKMLMQSVDAIYHCAANVNHFGHLHELYADNVTATARLIDLAEGCAMGPADFHYISTLSVADNPPESGFELFTEDHLPPQKMSENYYVRTKQEAERLVIGARDRLNNASIHRVGNVVFAAENTVLQKGVAHNAFFRQLAAFVKIGKVPDGLHVWLCHVDCVADAIVRLSQTESLKNEIFHMENSQRLDVSALITHPESGFETVDECDFGTFLDKLIDIIDEPEFSKPLSEVVETFGLIRGRAPQPRGRTLEVVTDRTQKMLSQLGFSWPEVPVSGLRTLLTHAQDHFADDTSEVYEETSQC